MTDASDAAVSQTQQITRKSMQNKLSRRRVLKSSAALGAALAWAPIFRVSPASADATCSVPPNFPSGIPLFQQAFENWSGEIEIDDLWTCEPSSAAQLPTLANWAAAEGSMLRARGFMHNWSPIHVTGDATCQTPVVLVDMTTHFATMSIDSSSPPAVRTGAGASMEDLLSFLESQGYGVTSCPAPGDLTVGGVLAIGGHGTGIPANDESRKPGQTFGSMSNRILTLTAVVWDDLEGAYVVREFFRDEPEMKALLVSLGRTIITEVTLRVEANHNLRCQSRIDIPASEMFAAPGSDGRTLESYLGKSGRIEAIWFPFTSNPWLKVWSVRRHKPLSSRAVDAPYNYPFSDNISKQLSDLLQRLLQQNPDLTPSFGQLLYNITAIGLVFGRSLDLWGPSKNLLHYVKPTTLRVNANGYAILTRRSDVQRVVHEFVRRYESQIADYAVEGKYPINNPVEIRVTGLDNPAEADTVGGQSPSLSALAEREDHPEWDVAVWLDLLTMPGTEHAGEFYSALEDWVVDNYSGSYAAVRVEWSKGWAYSNLGPWTDTSFIENVVPETLRAGRPLTGGWDEAVIRLDALDPHRVFSNPFLDGLLQSWR